MKKFLPLSLIFFSIFMLASHANAGGCSYANVMFCEDDFIYVSDSCKDFVGVELGEQIKNPEVLQNAAKKAVKAGTIMTTVTGFCEYPLHGNILFNKNFDPYETDDLLGNIAGCAVSPNTSYLTYYIAYTEAQEFNLGNTKVAAGICKSKKQKGKFLFKAISETGETVASIYIFGSPTDPLFSPPKSISDSLSYVDISLTKNGTYTYAKQFFFFNNDKYISDLRLSRTKSLLPGKDRICDDCRKKDIFLIIDSAKENQPVEMYQYKDDKITKIWDIKDGQEKFKELDKEQV
ncbi:hypothetical protein Dip510_000791 [Elusimicrobium posterum]|uniref:hypothetical protein n=1 Tax=Elusimicrobium posterum TaxID=3116653 RepID=UPI003C7454A9